MQSRWSDAEAAEFVARYRGAGDDVALRVYTSRLIGRDPELVLHGGGNTSVKTTVVDLFGRPVEVMAVKGSGSDLADVEPKGLPAVRLLPLRELRGLGKLSDDDMVAAVRSALIDPNAPNPSVEALLHAFLPHKFVDHTHADAILALTDQPDGARLVQQALGADVPALPWIMPGFPLAKAVADAFERAPQCRGIVLLKHGIFTFGATAKESYERMIALVAAAERFLAARGAARPAMLQSTAAVLPLAARRALLVQALPQLRGALAGEGDGRRRVVAAVRTADDLAAFSAHQDARALCASGPITPDHVIRTKGRYLYLSRAEAVDAAACAVAVRAYTAAYERYFAAGAPHHGVTSMLSPRPCVAVIEGCGLVAFGNARKAAAIAADIAEHTLRVKAQAQALGRYEPLTELELFAMEYWPLELRKLGAQTMPLLAGQVALVTGAAGAIGCGIAEALLGHGACVCLVDIDAARLQKVQERLEAHRGQLLAVTADLTDAAQVDAAFAECVLAFGGVDCVVPNAGIAHVSKLADMDMARFHQVLEVNTTGTMLVLRAAAKIFAAQRTGGSVVVQASKNAFAPGAGFGAYSASKAAALQLGRIAALEFAEYGVTVNMINADAVFGDDEVPSQLWQAVGPERMQARGLDAAGLREFYRQRSLLKTTVLPRHVGAAVVFFASGATPTTGAVLPVDGGLPEAFPR
jgi:rhamnulose-1-phosphate aldolase/alcohol dehydrogenase